MIIDKKAENFLGEYTVGDRYRYPYFIFKESVFNPSLMQFVEDYIIPGDYTAIKFCARHISNNKDPNDHTKDNIYSNLTNDVSGVYHYEWGANDLLRAGVYYVRLEFEKTNGRKFHLPTYYFYTVEEKMVSSIGTK